MVCGIGDLCLEVGGNVSKHCPQAAPKGKKAPMLQPEPSANRAKGSNGQPKGKEKAKEKARAATPGPRRVGKPEHPGELILEGPRKA